VHFGSDSIAALVPRTSIDPSPLRLNSGGPSSMLRATERASGPAQSQLHVPIRGHRPSFVSGRRVGRHSGRLGSGLCSFIRDVFQPPGVQWLGFGACSESGPGHSRGFQCHVSGCARVLRPLIKTYVYELGNGALGDLVSRRKELFADHDVGSGGGGGAGFSVSGPLL
jgi:hypothetical protein